MKKILLAVAAIAVLAITAGGRESKSRTDLTETARNLTIFNSIVKELQVRYVDTIDSKKVVNHAIDAMLNRIDPYTEYFPEEDQEDVLMLSTGKYAGIGAIIAKRDKNTIIEQLVWDAPAMKSGVRVGDRILAINDEDITPGTNVSEVSKRLRGQAGSKLTVKLQRPYTDDSIVTVEITRKNIEVNPLPYFGIDSAGIGYIGLSTFNEQSGNAVRDALIELKKNPELKGLVLDLRNNGGGLLERAVDIVGLFVPKNTVVVRTRGFDQDNEVVYKTTRKPVDTELPLVVMINGNSASSSEIVAGALQDLDRAVIVGTRSYGKGLVQSTVQVPYNGILKITTARYYIPSGRLIQAIDYSHRNPDGSPARIPDSLTKVWKTNGGRDVRDGGGISPDVQVEDTVWNMLLNSIVGDYWAHDYVNRFASQHDSLPDADSYVVGDSIFADFKNFIDPERFKYDRMCQEGIDFLRKATKAEGYDNDSVKAQIDLLAQMLRHDLDHDFNVNRDRIIEILDSEISSRYYDESGVKKRSLKYDLEYDTARAVVLDRKRIDNILHPEKQ